MSAAEPRLRQLVESGIALTSELSLDSLLQGIVETAAAITRARYAALGVIDQGRSGLERFITAGIDERARAEIGDLPRGRGILGVLIREATPLRLHELGEDARSVGFPPGHPPMSTFLGVPLVLRGVAYGNLYLTEKEGGVDFTEEDEDLATLLAAQAAVAIENARLYESSTRWLRQLESLNEITDGIAMEQELPRLLQLVATSLRELIDARIVTVWVPAGDDVLQLEAVAGEWPAELRGMRRRHADSKLSRVFERGQSVRVDSMLDDPEVDQETARRLGLKTGLWVLLLAGRRPVGIIAAYDKRGLESRFSDDDLRLAEALAARAAVAVELRHRVSREQVRSLLQMQERERRRISRELHDETGQALTSIILALKPLEARVGAEEIKPVRDLIAETLVGVRRLALELRPSVLDDFGLAPALDRLTEGAAEAAGLDVNLHCDLAGVARLDDELETAVYRVVQEALTNTVKHARARSVRVAVALGNRSVKVVVEDDGEGFSLAEVGADRLGLRGIRERADLLSGSVSLDSSPGRGTKIAVEFPVRKATAADGVPAREVVRTYPAT